MIPCLAIPVLNRPDLLQRCMESVDFDTKHLVLINNGGISMHSVKSEWIEGQHWFDMGENIGVAGSWNFAMDWAFSLHELSSVLIVGSDIQFSPGDLEMFDRAFRENPDADFVNGNHAFSTFAITRKGHEKLGWFDESFRMAYCEDSDFWRRIVLSGAKTVSVPTNSIHGEPPHFESSTINSDPELRRVVKAQQEINWTYFIRKWGAKRHTGRSETFVHPFNDPDWPLNYWVLDEERKQYPYFRANG